MLQCIGHGKINGNTVLPATSFDIESDNKNETNNDSNSSNSDDDPSLINKLDGSLTVKLPMLW